MPDMVLQLRNNNLVNSLLTIIVLLQPQLAILVKSSDKVLKIFNYCSAFRFTSLKSYSDNFRVTDGEKLASVLGINGLSGVFFDQLTAANCIKC